MINVTDLTHKFESLEPITPLAPPVEQRKSKGSNKNEFKRKLLEDGIRSIPKLVTKEGKIINKEGRVLQQNKSYFSY